MEKCVCMQCLLYEPVSDLQGPKRTFESCIYLEMKDVPVVTCDFLSQQSQVSWLISINTGHGLTSWIYQAWDICRVVQKCQQNICAKTHPKGRTLNASQNTQQLRHTIGGMPFPQNLQWTSCPQERLTIVVHQVCHDFPLQSAGRGLQKLQQHVECLWNLAALSVFRDEAVGPKLWRLLPLTYLQHSLA